MNKNTHEINKKTAWLARAHAGVAALAAIPLFLMGMTCRSSDTERIPAPVQSVEMVEAPPEPADVAETAYDGKLGPGWYDFGWSQRNVGEGPVRVNMSGWGGWIVAHPGLDGSFQSLAFQFKGPTEFGDFFQVKLASAREQERDLFPSIIITKARKKSLPNGFDQVVLPLSALNPKGLAFDRIIFVAGKEVSAKMVEIDKVVLTKKKLVKQPAKSIELSIDCTKPAHRISPYIYGVAYSEKDEQRTLGTTARRWGGNATSRYNWQLGNAWNTAADWYFQNINYSKNPKYSFRDYLNDNAANKMLTALTVPMIGWVAKDTTSYSYSVSRYGPQKSSDPYRNDAGNGVRPDGSQIKADPRHTSIPAPPSFVKDWISAIRAEDKLKGRTQENIYILDNEPMLWHLTHKDVHPTPVSYDELLDRTIQYGTAVREADPNGRIAGPALWGWSAYFFSGKDVALGVQNKPDRLAHGDLPFLPWYLRRLHEHEQKTGKRVLDLLDVHFYPQAEGVHSSKENVSTQEAALRIRSTRALWDTSYVDESWIAEPVKLIPRLKAWIHENYPNLGIQIGEYNFGGEKHMSGGLAEAEALGRFAEYGVYSAFYWMTPALGSPAYWAFRAFRNYDGKGGRFLDFFVDAEGTSEVSLFVSRDEGQSQLVAIALNLAQDRPLTVQTRVTGCKKATSQRKFQYVGDTAGFKQEEGTHPDEGKPAFGTLPPFSMTVVEASLEKPPAP